MEDHGGCGLEGYIGTHLLVTFLFCYPVFVKRDASPSYKSDMAYFPRSKANMTMGPGTQINLSSLKIISNIYDSKGKPRPHKQMYLRR